MIRNLDTRMVIVQGAFGAARERNGKYLLSLDPDRLLHRFCENADLTPKAPLYGGWEQATISGHSLGHYLSACARYAVRDRQFAERVAHITEELARCQAARTDGFIGGMPEAHRVFGELQAGIIRSSGFDLNDCWVPWYNQHKLFAGLLDAATFCQETQIGTQALDIATTLGDWAIGVTAQLDTAQWQQMLGCEFGGMSESLANLAHATGQQRFLDLARKFHHDAVLDPLERGEDRLAGLHANTQVPKVIGCARLYELTGETRYKDIAENFWRFVVEDHTYCIGGNSCGEYFGEPRKLAERLTEATCETCNTYNMLKLTRHLFAWEPRASLFDYAERALYNQILPSQHPETGMFAYFTPLHSSATRTYSTPEDSFWCCVGSGMENHAMYEEYLYAVDESNKTLYVNMFEQSEVKLGEMTLIQRSGLSDFVNGSLDLQATASGNEGWTIKVRIPKWGKREDVHKPGSDGYVISTPTPKQFVVENFYQNYYTEPMPDNPNRVALFRGPYVLAQFYGIAPENGKESPNSTIPPAPVIISDSESPDDWLQVLHAMTIPFLWLTIPCSSQQRYTIYFDKFTPEEWAREEGAYRLKEKQDHERRTQTIDEFWPGQMQPERDHHFTYEGDVIASERSAWKYREARNGGAYVFTLKTLPDRPLELFCKYGAPKESEAQTSQFRVFVEGVQIASPAFAATLGLKHQDTVHQIPEELTNGKTQITVRVQAADNATSGPLFLCRMQKQLQP
jgi:uncharacterized protein